MESFSALPGLNLGTLAALILMALPVRGLRPVRAARLPTLNVPNPIKETLCFFFRLLLIAVKAPSNALLAEAFERSACLAMASMSSDLFTRFPFRCGCESNGKILQALV